MAAVNPLGSFAALVDRLAPIADKRRGMRIDADEWNALVGVVRGMLELEFRQEASLETKFRERFAPRRHEHTGEIGLAALDAELQARLTGEAGGVAMRFTLRGMHSKLDALSTEVVRLTALAGALQSQLDRAQVDDLERHSKLRGFEDRFAQVENLRGLVGDLNHQVGALAPGIEAVVQMRDALGGVDLPALQTRITDLESLRASLTGPDGKPLRLRDVLVQLDELEEVVKSGTSGGLEERFGTLEANLDTKLDTRLNESLAAAREAAIAQLSDVRGDLDNRLDARLEETRSGLMQELGAAVSANQETLEASFATRLDAISGDLRATLGAEAAARIDGRLAGLSTQIAETARGAVAAAVPELRAQVVASVRTDVEARVAAAEAAVAAHADALDARFADRDAALSAQIAERVAQELPATVDAGLGRATQALSAQLTARVDQQLAQSREALSATLQDLAVAAVGGALGDVDGRIAAQLEPQLARLEASARDAASTALGDIEALVVKHVSTQIEAIELDRRFAKLSDSVVTQLRREIDTSSAQLREEMAAARNEDRAILSGEIVLARDEAVKVSLDQIGVLEAGQEQLSARIDRTEQTVLTKADALVRDRTIALEGRLTQIEKVRSPVLRPIQRPPIV